MLYYIVSTTSCRVFTSSKVMFELMTVQPSVFSEVVDPVRRAALTTEQADITFEDVVFRYVEGKEILRGLSLTVPAGSSVAIVGGSGSGKSTIIRLLYRFLEPNQGKIKVAGKDIR